MTKEKAFALLEEGKYNEVIEIITSSEYSEDFREHLEGRLEEQPEPKKWLTALLEDFFLQR